MDKLDEEALGVTGLDEEVVETTEVGETEKETINKAKALIKQRVTANLLRKMTPGDVSQYVRAKRLMGGKITEVYATEEDVKLDIIRGNIDLFTEDERLELLGKIMGNQEMTIDADSEITSKPEEAKGSSKQ